MDKLNTKLTLLQNPHLTKNQQGKRNKTNKELEKYISHWRDCKFQAK